MMHKKKQMFSYQDEVSKRQANPTRDSCINYLTQRKTNTRWYRLYEASKV